MTSSALYVSTFNFGFCGRFWSPYILVSKVSHLVIPPMLLAKVFLVTLMMLIANVNSSLLYTYLHQGGRLCTIPDHIRPIGKEDRYMVHYEFTDGQLPEGKVTMHIRTSAWLGPTILRDLDPKHSSVTVDLVTGQDYRFCFEYEGVRSRIPFQFEIGRANTNPLVDAHEDTVDTYMDLVQSIEVGVAQVADEVETIMTRQWAFEGTVRSAYTRVIVFTIISVTIVVGVAAWQIFALKSFFRAKKIV